MKCWQSLTWKTRRDAYLPHHNNVLATIAGLPKSSESPVLNANTEKEKLNSALALWDLYHPEGDVVAVGKGNNGEPTILSKDVDDFLAEGIAVYLSIMLND